MTPALWHKDVEISQIVGFKTKIGAGWTFGPTDRLVSIAADPTDGLPAGLLRVFGTGGYRFYAASGSSYTSQSNDSGVLTAVAGGGYLYTGADGTKKTFDANGNQTSSVSADGHQVTQFSYASGLLVSVTTPDGGVSSFGYNPSGKLASIQSPGPRSYTLAYTGLDLTSIANPDGGVETYTYDGSERMLSDVIGSLSNSWTYGPGGGEASATWGSAGSPGVSDLDPVDAQGLSAAVSGPVQALETDPTGDPAHVTLDAAGRPIAETQADGSTETWTRDPVTGYVTSQTDFLGRTTSFVNDAQGYVTSETLPDGKTTPDFRLRRRFPRP